MLKIVLRALDRMGLVEETWETYQLLLALALDHTAAENPGPPRDMQLPGCLCLGFLLEWDIEAGEGSHSASEGWL